MQIHVRAPISKPPCLSSYRASFVNSYSSVRVRPGAPVYGDHDVTAASRPVNAFVPVRIRLVTPISDCAESDKLSGPEYGHNFCHLLGSFSDLFSDMIETAAMMQSDASLVAESLAGNREAFGQIVARYQALICSLAYSGTGNLSQSEDVAQETFIAAWK